jgi:hypothetical protein
MKKKKEKKRKRKRIRRWLYPGTLQTTKTPEPHISLRGVAAMINRPALV